MEKIKLLIVRRELYALVTYSHQKKYQLWYKGQAPRFQISKMNSVCTKRPLNIAHAPCIVAGAKTLFLKGVRYKCSSSFIKYSACALILTGNNHHSERNPEYLGLWAWSLCTDRQLVAVLDQSSAPRGGSSSWYLLTIQHCGLVRIKGGCGVRLY